MEIYVDKDLRNAILKTKLIDNIQTGLRIGNTILDEASKDEAIIAKYQAITKAFRDTIIDENELGDDFKKQYIGFENYITGAVLADLFDIDVEAEASKEELVTYLFLKKAGK